MYIIIMYIIIMHMFEKQQPYQYGRGNIIYLYDLNLFNTGDL